MTRADTDGHGAGNGGPARVLDGLKVLDLTWYGAGPIGNRALANLGADVIRIETGKRPDITRTSPRPAGISSLNQGGMFNDWNTEKRAVTIDLTMERGHELGIELVKWADVLHTNMTNRAIEQIGMTWDVVSAANPGIIAAYQPMQGMTGPHSDFLGIGAILSAVCGVNYITGFDGNPPVGAGTHYTDFVVGPMSVAIALLAAIRHQRRTGEGQLIDVSQFEAGVAAMAGPLFAYDNAGIDYQRLGNRVGFAAPHGVFQLAGEDRWLAIACLDDGQWGRLAAVCGHPEWSDHPDFATLADRKANEDALEGLIREWAAGQDGRDAMARLQAADVPAGFVQSASEVLADEHLAERGYWVYMDHPEAGHRAHDGPGWRLSKTPIEVRGVSPMLGQHTWEVCTEILGLSADEIADLAAEEVLS